MRDNAGPAAVSRLLEIVGSTIEPFALETRGGFSGGLRAVIEAAAADPVLGNDLLDAIVDQLVVTDAEGLEKDLMNFAKHPFGGGSPSRREMALRNALHALQVMVATGTVLDAIDLALNDADVGSIFTGEMDTVTVEVLLDGAAIGEATIAVQGDRGDTNPCPTFPAGDYESPFNIVSISPDVVNPGGFVSVKFTYNFADPDASTDGTQAFKVWIPFVDIGEDILVDGVPLQIDSDRLVSDQVMLPGGGHARARVIDLHDDNLFDTFSLSGPETLVGYPTGTTVVRISPADGSTQGVDSHTVQFTLPTLFPNPSGTQTICPHQTTTPERPGNIYWVGPLITVDWGETFRFWSPGLPELARAGAALAPFEILLPK